MRGTAMTELLDSIFITNDPFVIASSLGLVGLFVTAMVCAFMPEYESDDDD